MPVIPKTHRHEFKIDGNGIISSAVHGENGETEEFASLIDFKNFYNELHDTLIENKHVKFVDMLGPKKDKDKGNFFDHQSPRSIYYSQAKQWKNRTGDMFEDHFVWAYHGDYEEMEMNWRAKAPTKYSAHGWFEVKINMVNRTVLNKEVLMGNEKKVLKGGKWEFRNEFYYKNGVILKYLHKIPIVKNSATLQRLYIDYVYNKILQKDIDYCWDNLKPIIYDVIHKHMKTLK